MTTNSGHTNTLRGSAMLSLGALGVVYGDIGTSPIYAFKESVHAAGSTKDDVL